MRVLLINGSPHEHGCTYTALSEIVKVLDKNSVESEILYLGKDAIPGCLDCSYCGDAGRCIVDDKVNRILDDLGNISALIAGSPVYYGGASGQLKAFLDRLFFAGTSGMAGKPGASVVSCRRGGAASTFDQLNKYFALSSMPLVTSQYWNQVHGFTPEEVMQDKEGLQTMRVLGENLVWLLRCIEAGEKANVPRPVYEKRIMTNFIG